MFRHFNERVGVNTQNVAEFSIGDKIQFHDEITGKTGTGVIWAFAQMGYDPTVWYLDENEEIGTVHLGWCTKEET